MPESVTDRPTSAHEKLFLMSKSAKYFYDAEAVRVKASGEVRRTSSGRRDVSVTDTGINEFGNRVQDSIDVGEPIPGVNLRNVWKIATHSFSDAHFATFPRLLSRASRRAVLSRRVRQCARSAARLGCGRLRRRY